MSLHVFQISPFTRRLLWRLAAGRARDTVGHLRPLLRPGERLLDVGAGLCDVTLLLQQAGHRITPLDVEDFSCTPELRPVLYDGRTMPFADNSFDTALILTVLHHTRDPEQVLREARRVAQRIIVIEDVYYNRLHKFATFFMDSLLNLEFFGHPHTNKTDAEWQATFDALHLRVEVKQEMKSFMILRHRLYVLGRATQPEEFRHLGSSKHATSEHVLRPARAEILQAGSPKPEAKKSIEPEGQAS